MTTVCVQVQQSASKWEFYICNEIKSRLTDLNDPVDVVCIAAIIVQSNLR